MNIEYVGEHLIYGKLGNILIITAFISAIVASIAYIFSSFRPAEENQWKPFARKLFFLHSFCVVGIFALLFYLIFNHYFEYYYVWQHSSTELPVRYIFACFWEGQEGSFLLWTFWHCVLSFFLIKKSAEWEGPVMATICMVQVFLCSMVLGVYLFDYKIGSNPFTLLRDHPDFANLPFVKMPDYLSRIEDGRGLNPLLQNYWMVIHPPVLFLGFASTVIPFAFALGGLFTGKVREWVRPALSYTFFGVMILGTGILMGAAWAYEALSFGGFWAWDPVENSSLVPWLTLAGAAHVLLIFKKNGKALMTCFILCITSFLLVLYSTFLTRSGILGDSSVHAFTDLGMSGQLLIYMAFFAILALVLIIKNRKKIPSDKEDDSSTSREFWMFIGVLVLVISCVQIILTTSLPVFNKVFHTNMAPPVDLIGQYNAWQIPIAIVITVLMGIGQFFKYKKSDAKQVFKKLIFSLVASVLICALAEWFLKFSKPHFIALLFTAIFAVIANLDYLFRILKGKIEHSGASIAHVGIALILLGALISNANSKIISKNSLLVDLGKDFPNNENIMLVKGDTLKMANYYVTYTGKEKKGVNVFYNIDYLQPSTTHGELEKKFTLSPIIQLNKRMGNAAEPATQHFFTRDIYTHVTYADMEEFEKKNQDDYREPHDEMMTIGDTISTSNSLVILTALDKDVSRKELNLEENDLAVAAILKIIDVNKKEHEARPVFIIHDRSVFTKEALVDELGLKIVFEKIDPDNGKVHFKISEKKSNSKEFIIMKAIIFPHINILWTGCILMILGTWIAIRKRMAENKRVEIKQEA